MRSFIAAFRFLTRLPLPGPETRVEDLSAAVGWFPLVGACVGLATAGAFVFASRLWAAPIAATLAVAFGLLLTGGFHEDGRGTFGHSLVVAPWGQVIAKLDHDEPGVLLADLDFAEVAKARGAVPALTHDRAYAAPLTATSQAAE